MRPQVINKSGTGTTNWIPLDYKQNPFNVGFGCVISDTATYSVEHTFDDIFDSTVTPTAFQHGTVVGQSANANSNYAFPVRAVRLNVTASTGNVTLTLLQGLR